MTFHMHTLSGDLEVGAVVMEWGDSFVNVVLNWIHEDINGDNYVSVEPPTFMRLIGNTSVELSVDYNKSYNVSITTTICGKNSSNTTTLFYAYYYG